MHITTWEWWCSAIGLGVTKCHGDPGCSSIFRGLEVVLGVGVGQRELFVTSLERYLLELSPRRYNQYTSTVSTWQPLFSMMIG